MIGARAAGFPEQGRAPWRDAISVPFGPWPGRLGFPHILSWISACLLREIEQRRLFPWLAVAYGLGILLAFAADGPLSLSPPLLAGALAVALAFGLRHRLAGLAVALGIAALMVGFAAVVVRLKLMDVPVLQRLTVAGLEGFVETVEARSGGGARLVIRVTKMDGVTDAARPPRVRVTTRQLSGIAPGDHVAAKVRLMPPPEAARPGGYDFARDAYFRGLGAVGSVSGRMTRNDTPPLPRDIGLAVAAGVDAARNALTERIAGTIGGQAGAVAAALVTGKRGLIDEATNDVLRAAGIYHVVSISGLHMVLAAGTVFWLARALLALSPALALGWPIKKIAAVVGMVGATGYCVFSGADVAAERSLVMILVMQGAILVDRPALSIRNLALSAILVLTREPEALLGPSFQMSYAAVAGLIAFAETIRRVRPRQEARDPFRRAAMWIGGIALGTVGTTLVATVMTGPFGAFHFQNLQPYGLVGNAATLPLISFVVMPAAVIGVLVYPFGLDRPVWTAMGWATEGVLRLSEWVAGFAGSTIVVPAYGSGALILFVVAILCATLFVSGLRLIALLPALLGIVLARAPARPDIYIARDGSGIAVRTQDGRLALAGRVSAFTVEQWLRADGDPRRAGDPSLVAPARCDRIGCTIVMPDGRVASHLVERRGFREDCRRAALVVSRLAAPAGCAASVVADRAFLATRGATALSAQPSGGFAIETVRSATESRPWFTRPAEPNRTTDPAGPERDRARPTARPERLPDDDPGVLDTPDTDPGLP